MKLHNLLPIFKPQLPYPEHASNDRATVRLRKIPIKGSYIYENQHKCNIGSDKKGKKQVKCYQAIKSMNLKTQ